MLWLIGMMGSGKTTIGVEVAAAGGLDFVDTDLLVASLTDKSIAELWETEGESAFRRLESQMIASAATGDPVVVATGGGAVLDGDNIAAMRRSGLVVWLRASPETLFARIGQDGARPLVADTDAPIEALGDLLAEREGRYAEAAHARVDTDGRTIESIVAEVIALWDAS